LHVCATDRVACGALAAAERRRLSFAGEQLMQRCSLDGDTGGGLDEKGGQNGDDLHFMF